MIASLCSLGAVNNLIRSIVSTIALYPKKYVIPMVDEVDIKALTSPTPVGLLHLTVSSAKKLKIADLTKSDPFVEVRFMDTTYKTQVVYKELNPIWYIITLYVCTSFMHV
jgi:Ca2+-dependent lipid-binding protein